MNNVIFTKVKIVRNVKDYKFMPKLEKDKALEIENKLESALGKDFYKVILSNADAQVIKYLKENELINANTKGVFVDKKNSLSVSLFEGEHILIRSTGFGMDLKAVKNALNLASSISNKIALAYSDEYGYLMSNLMFLGAGLSIEAEIDLNAIVSIGKIEQVKQNVKKLGFGLIEKQPNIYTIFTSCKLGFSEKEIVDEFTKMVTKLQELEVESAKLLDVSRHEEVVDKILRSGAILSSAYLMGEEELKTHLSILRTGLNLGVTDISLEKINKIQKLILNKNSEIVSQSEMVQLANSVKDILKGE